jgi:hypothetical protein
MHEKNRRAIFLLGALCAGSVLFGLDVGAQTPTDPKVHQPSAMRAPDHSVDGGEWYVAGFGGYTLGHGLMIPPGRGNSPV